MVYNAPHFPYQAPEDEIKYFRGKNKFNEKLCTLYAMIRRMDKGVERIIEELKRQGIEDNTVVIFTSDNGPQLKGDLKRYNGNFRGQKITVYEGGIRVPAVIKWPAELDKELITDSPVHFTKDPSEKNNLAGDNPKRVESMLKDYEAWFNKMESERRMIE